MALDTLCTTSNLKQNFPSRFFDGLAFFTWQFVKMMPLVIIDRGLVTLQAERIALLVQFYGVHIMAI